MNWIMDLVWMIDNRSIGELLKMVRMLLGGTKLIVDEGEEKAAETRRG